LSHHPTCAAGADAAPLAREGYESVVLALGAIEAHEASFEFATGEVTGEGEVDEARERFTLIGEPLVQIR